jgi:ribA/ribD-fused uncharacterized protein
VRKTARNVNDKKLSGGAMSKIISCFQDEAGNHLWPSNFFWHNHWTVEHEFQSAKTHSFRQALAIRRAATPGQAKRLGRRCDLVYNWDEIKDDVMMSCLEKKFEIPELRAVLLATGDALLIEGNTWGDRYWGATRPSPSEIRGVLSSGKIDYTWETEDGSVLFGYNKLGILLMGIREELQEQSK